MTRFGFILCGTVLAYCALKITMAMGLWGLGAWTLLVLSGAVLWTGVRR